jgi:hypothetical protein
MKGRDRQAESAAACGMIAPWKAQEAPLIRNSVSSALDARSLGSGQLPVPVVIAASIACDAMSSLRFALPVASMGRLPA